MFLIKANKVRDEVTIFRINKVEIKARSIMVNLAQFQI